MGKQKSQVPSHLATPGPLNLFLEKLGQMLAGMPEGTYTFTLRVLDGPRWEIPHYSRNMDGFPPYSSS